MNIQISGILSRDSLLPVSFGSNKSRRFGIWNVRRDHVQIHSFIFFFEIELASLDILLLDPLSSDIRTLPTICRIRDELHGYLVLMLSDMRLSVGQFK